MIIYEFNETTREYIGEIEASLDPVATEIAGENVYLIPAFATELKPPKTGKNETVLFLNGAWNKVADYRGEYIVNPEMQPFIYNELGELPDGYVAITQAQAEKIQEDDLYYVISKGKLVINPNYNAQKQDRRIAEFYSKFLATSKGNYRLQPKGYSNAQQSIDTVNGIVNAIGSLTSEIAQMVLFYPTPDFSDEEQCTEEWLVAHQTNIDTMTKEQWTNFYIEFSTLYARNQYKPSEVQ